VTAGVEITTCTRCGAAFFPQRLLCPRCGNDGWTTHLVTHGELEESTVIRTGFDRPDDQPSYLGSMRVADVAAPLVVGLDRELEPGTRLRITQVDGAVHGQAETP
jgi:uncharacterized OB-fold protein